MPKLTVLDEPMNAEDSVPVTDEPQVSVADPGTLVPVSPPLEIVLS
jgi:hypothetical protein